jgi:uncharacterized protein YjiS (DUF1127 family)
MSALGKERETMITKQNTTCCELREHPHGSEGFGAMFVRQNTLKPEPVAYSEYKNKTKHTSTQTGPMAHIGKGTKSMATFSTNTTAHAHGFSFSAVFNAFATLIEVAKQRRALGQLDDTRLADLGITAKQAHSEAKKPFWNAPKNWKS